MARKTIVVLTDDLTGGEADQTVTFSVQGADYEIDLNQTNADNLIATLQPFIDAGRKAGSSRGPRAMSKRNDLADVRAWARERGFEVSDRGRVSQEIMTAYQQMRK